MIFVLFLCKVRQELHKVEFSYMMKLIDFDCWFYIGYLVGQLNSGT